MGDEPLASRHRRQCHALLRSGQHLRDPPVRSPLPAQVASVAALLLEVVDDVFQGDAVAVVEEPVVPAPEFRALDCVTARLRGAVSDGRCGRGDGG